MPSLMTLPLEVRFNIIDLVVKPNTSTPPKDQTDAPDRAPAEGGVLHNPFVDHARNRYLIDPDRYEFNTSGLLYTSRQLRAEILSQVSTGKGSNVEYALDVMVVIGQPHQIWPTWTYLPIPTTKVDTLSVTYRIFRPSEYRLGDSKGPTPKAVYMGFSGVLEQFLKVGPTKPIKGGEEGSLEYTDKRLSIRLLNLEAPNEALLQVTHTSHIRLCWEALLVELTKALALYSADPNVADAIYERVGFIRVTCSGEVEKEFDLSEEITRKIEAPLQRYPGHEHDHMVPQSPLYEATRQKVLRRWTRLLALRSDFGAWPVRRPAGMPAPTEL